MTRYLAPLMGGIHPNMAGNLLASRPPVSLSRAALVFIAGNLLPLGLMALLSGGEDATAGLTAVVVAQPLILIALTLLSEGRPRNINLFPILPISGASLALFALVWPALLRIAAVAVAAGQAVFGLVAEETNNPLLMDLDMDGFQMALVIMSVVILIPIAEEIFYRDLLYRSLGGLGVWPSAALTSMFWAVMHGSLAFILPLFIVGLLLTMLYESTENLLVPIIAHVGFNLSSILVVILLPSIGGVI